MKRGAEPASYGQYERRILLVSEEYTMRHILVQRQGERNFRTSNLQKVGLYNSRRVNDDRFGTERVPGKGR